MWIFFITFLFFFFFVDIYISKTLTVALNCPCSYVHMFIGLVCCVPTSIKCAFHFYRIISIRCNVDYIAIVLWSLSNDIKRRHTISRIRSHALVTDESNAISNENNQRQYLFYNLIFVVVHFNRVFIWIYDVFTSHEDNLTCHLLAHAHTEWDSLTRNPGRKPSYRQWSNRISEIRSINQILNHRFCGWHLRMTVYFSSIRLHLIFFSRTVAVQWQAIWDYILTIIQLNWITTEVLRLSEHIQIDSTRKYSTHTHKFWK